MYASLDTFALHYGDILEVERKTGMDILWSEALDDVIDEGIVLVFNPPELDLKVPKLEFRNPNYPSGIMLYSNVTGRMIAGGMMGGVIKKDDKYD